MEIGGVTKTIFDETKDVILTWFSVLSKGPAAIARIDLGSNSALLFALRFLFYVSLVDFVVSIPSAAANGVKYDDKMFAGVSIASIYVEYISVALILYWVMNLFGGKAALQACIAGYCFLTAYLPIAAVIRSPCEGILDAAIKTGTNYPDSTQRIFAAIVGLPAWDRVVFLLAGVLSVAVYIFFLVGVFRLFRTLHGLSAQRARWSFALGMLGALAFAAAFVMPFDGAIARAFTAK